MHNDGEEFFVLEDVFQDQHGDYPAGSYIRNPPESSHKPGAEDTCIIFVKLWQFEPSDRTHVVLNTHFMQATQLSDQPGVSVISLYRDKYENVSVYHIEANTKFTLNPDDGLELLVLDGSLTESTDNLTQYSWLRLPASSNLNAYTGNETARVWVKQNHLINVNEQIKRINDISA